jgi:nucleoside-diphosphate-sugar epimerase
LHTDQQVSDRDALLGRRILVTGASGIVGPNVVLALLRAGADVISVSRSGFKRDLDAKVAANHRTLLLDLRSEPLPADQIAEVTDCVHLAATLFPRSSTAFFHDNILITKNITSALVQGAGNLKRFVHVSSLAARGPGESADYRDPHLDARAVSCYGESKYAGEAVVRSLLPEAIALTILRPGIVLSSEDHRLVLTAKSLRFTPTFVLERMPQAISAIAVEDLTQAIMASLTTEPAPRGVFEITHPEPIRVHEIAKRGRRRDPSQPIKPVWIMSAIAVLSTAAAYFSGTTPMLTFDKLREMGHAKWCGDSTPFTAATGWKPEIDPYSFLKPYVT